MIQASKIIGSGLATIGLIGAGVGIGAIFTVIPFMLQLYVLISPSVKTIVSYSIKWYYVIYDFCSLNYICYIFVRVILLLIPLCVVYMQTDLIFCMDNITDVIISLDDRIADLNDEYNNYVSRMRNSTPGSTLCQDFPEFHRSNREQYRQLLREVEHWSNIRTSYRNLVWSTRYIDFTPRKG